MQPDYVAMVNDFIKPVVSLLLFVFLLLGWVTAFRLMRENTLLRIKLGKENEEVRESFKISMLRKSAPIVLPIYELKTSLQERQPYIAFKKLFKKKTLKLAFRYGVIASIVSSIFSIDTTRSS